MSGVSSLSLRRELLGLFFRGSTPGYSAFQVCLTRRIPTTNSAINQLDEPTTGGYARVEIPFGGIGQWRQINDNEVGYDGTVYFPTATDLWGTIAGWALLDTPASRVMAVGTLNEPFKCVAGIRPYLGPDDLSFGLFD